MARVRVPPSLYNNIVVGKKVILVEYYFLSVDSVIIETTNYLNSR